jgi:DNA modification methylase
MPTPLQRSLILENVTDNTLNTETTGQTKSGVNWKVLNTDAATGLKTLEKESFHCAVTSPPYFWLRDYGVDGQLGLEDSVEGYINNLMQVMDEVYRTLRQDGVFFLNIGDTYYSGKGESQGKDPKSNKRRFGLRAVDKSGGLGIGIKPKSLIGIPWRVALAMIARGWVLRSSIIWYQKSSLPEAVKDRPKRSYENIFMFTKNRKYYFNKSTLKADEQEDMWTIVSRAKAAEGLKTAPYPDELVERCLDLACPEGGTVLDPFAGSGTTLRVAVSKGFAATGTELNTEFAQFIVKQLRKL